MADLLAVVESGDPGVESILAAEALRKAAADLGRGIDIEIHSAAGVRHPLTSTDIAAADKLLLVRSHEGNGTPPGGGLERFAGLRTHGAGIADVLADAAAVVKRFAELDTAAPASAGSAPPAAALPGVPAAPAVVRIVAITSCPTGIAHTFMAAEGLQQGAAQLGYEMRVETQGSVGARDGLTDAEIRAADLVIIAADTQIDLARFGGKRLFESPTKPAIIDGKSLITRALAEAQIYGSAAGSGALADSVDALKASRKSSATGAYKHLMTGVSYMLPFVVSGGLMIAIAFALGGIYAYDDAHKGTLAYALFQIGAKGAFMLIAPALAGYVAFSIADRPGIAPGMIGGLVAANMGAGFLGGIAAGFIAGYGVAWLNRTIKLPRNLEGLKPVLLLPFLGTLLTGLVMVYIVGGPVAQILAGLTVWLRGLQGANAVLLGLLIGAMMAFDMGGPVNKAAYAFATGLIASQVYTPMAAAMVAGMTPPLGLALACRLFGNRFTFDEREAGGAAAVLGLAFVTEGAIPFAARDPFRVIPSLMVGSAVAGAISMAAGVELRVPHGGIFVLPIPNAVSHLGPYLVALVAGTLVTTGMLAVLKRPIPEAALPAGLAAAA